jgi:hypothetical protein
MTIEEANAWVEEVRANPLVHQYDPECHRELMIDLFKQRNGEHWDLPNYIEELERLFAIVPVIEIRRYGILTKAGIQACCIKGTSYYVAIDLLIAISSNERYNQETLQRTILS